jgi:hypothetical protein
MRSSKSPGGFTAPSALQYPTAAQHRRARLEAALREARSEARGGEAEEIENLPPRLERQPRNCTRARASDLALDLASTRPRPRACACAAPAPRPRTSAHLHRASHLAPQRVHVVCCPLFKLVSNGAHKARSSAALRRSARTTEGRRRPILETKPKTKREGAPLRRSSAAPARLENQASTDMSEAGLLGRRSYPHPA